jgi:hypothetical protein
MTGIDIKNEMHTESIDLIRELTLGHSLHLSRENWRFGEGVPNVLSQRFHFARCFAAVTSSRELILGDEILIIFAKFCINANISDHIYIPQHVFGPYFHLC